MYLGLDIGTSAVKAVVMDDGGAVAAQASAPLSVSRPRPLWSEQNPDDWWRAADAAVRSLDPRLRAGLRGIGLAGQMHGATLLGEGDRVLRPAMLWNDGRAGAECAELEAAEPRSRTITGNRAMAGFTAPKLLWVRRHEAAVFAATRTVLLPKDYVRLVMTGDKATDVSDASGTLWVDVGARAWSAAMLQATHLDDRQMPALHEGSAVTGVLRAEIAAAWGMSRVPVAAGASDNAGAAIGLGVIDPGAAFLSLGTSGVILAADDRFRPNPAAAVHAFAHALPGRWHVMSVMLSAAACVEWGVALLGLADAAAFVALAETALPGAGGVMFLPYLSGERTPHDDPHARGTLFGLTAATGPACIARAILEGVAMGLRDGLEALQAGGVAVTALSVAGGGARSLFWGRILAATLGLPLLYRAGGDVGPAFGAARLARLATGGAPIAEICAPPPLASRIDPDAALADAARARHPLFRQLYAALRPSFRSLA
jgi:xylulokinase